MRPTRVLSVLALAGLAALLLAPAAAGDHVYTHRYYVSGRLLDAAGEPVSGAPVKAELPGTGVGPCHGFEGDPQRFWATRTGPEGDFRVCFHAHAFKPGQLVVVNASGENLSAPVDSDLRKTAFLHRLGANSTMKDAGALQFFAYRYAVEGRVWNRSGPQVLENVAAEGEAVAYADVKVTLTLADGTNVTRAERADGYGDYAAQFDRLTKPVRRVTVQAAGAAVERDADLAFRKSVVDVLLLPALAPPPAEPTGPPPGFEPPAGEVPPGSGTPTPAPGAAVALAAAVGAALALAHRKR